MSEEKQTVQEIVEEVAAEICDNYCKYPLIMDTEENAGQDMRQVSASEVVGGRNGIHIDRKVA